MPDDIYRTLGKQMGWIPQGLPTPPITITGSTPSPVAAPSGAPDTDWANPLAQPKASQPTPIYGPMNPNAPPVASNGPSQADVMAALDQGGNVTAAPNYTHDQRAKQLEDADRAEKKRKADEAAAKTRSVPHYAETGTTQSGQGLGFGVGMGGGSPAKNVRVDRADPEARAIMDQQHRDAPEQLMDREIDQRLQLQKRQDIIDNQMMDQFQARQDAKAEADRQAEATRKSQDDLATAQKAAASAVVDPGKFWAKKGTAGTILSAIGVALGAMGSSLTHSPNAALEMLNKSIDDDMRAQEQNLQQKNKSVDTALARFREQTGSEDAAKQVFKIAGLQYAQSQLQSLDVGDQGNALQEKLQDQINQEAKRYADYQQATHQTVTVGGGGGGINYLEARKTAEHFLDKDPSLTPGQAMQKALSLQTGQGPGLDMAGGGTGSEPVSLPSVKGTSTNWEFWRGIKGTDAHENTQKQTSYNRALERQLMQRFGNRGSSHFADLKITETDDPKEIDRKVRDAKQLMESVPVKGAPSQGGGGGMVDFSPDQSDEP